MQKLIVAVVTLKEYPIIWDMTVGTDWAKERTCRHVKWRQTELVLGTIQKDTWVIMFVEYRTDILLRGGIGYDWELRPGVRWSEMKSVLSKLTIAEATCPKYTNPTIPNIGLPERTYKSKC